MAGGGDKKSENESSASGTSTAGTSSAGTPANTPENVGDVNVQSGQGAANAGPSPGTGNTSPDAPPTTGPIGAPGTSQPAGSADLSSQPVNLEPQNTESKGFFTTIIDFFKPVSEKLSPECEEVETAFHTVKGRCERIDHLYKRQKSIWELSWEEVKEEIDSIRNSIMEGIRKPDRALLNTLFPIWYTCYKYMRQSLYDLEDIHEYIAPSIDGVDPVYEITEDSMKESSIGYVCWQMNVNFAHRMFVYTENFLRSSIRYCLQERGKARVAAAIPNLPVEIELVEMNISA